VAQQAGGADHPGGNLALLGGARTGTGAKGGVQIGLNGVGGDKLIQLLELAGQRVVGLLRSGFVTDSEMPANTGDLVLFFADCATAPTANPNSGTIVYSYVGGLTSRTPTTGVVVALSPSM
jgi:hypothetical protein